MIDNSRPFGVAGIGDNLTAVQWVGLIFAGWIIVILSSLLPELWQAPYSLVQDDARHHVVWLRRLANPELYANDPTAAFFLSQSPVVYRALFAPAHWLGIDVLVWHLLVVVPLTSLLTTIALYRFTIHILPTSLQRGLVTLILCLLLATAAMQGLQRNFSVAIFLFAWVAYLERRVLLTGLVFLIGANLYPVAAAAAGFGLLIHLLMPIRPYGLFNRRAVMTVVVAGIAGLAGLVPFLLASADAGPTLLLQDAQGLPIMQDGRSGFFKPSLWDQLLCHRVGGASLLPICIRTAGGDASTLTLAAYLAVIAMGLICYRWLLVGTGKRANAHAGRAAKVVLSSFIAGTVLFVAAYAAAFRLYLPDRYAFYATGLLFQFCAAFLVYAILIGLARLAGRILPPIRAALPVVVLEASWIGFVAFGSHGFGLVRDREPEISAYLRSSPQTSVVAGFDGYLDSVPAHGLRSSFTAIEFILPYKTDYFDLMRDRTLRLRDAFMTSSARELSEFAARENISFFLLRSGPLHISGLWKRSFPSLAALDGIEVPMGTVPGGTDCVVTSGHDVHLVDAACLGGGP